MPIVSCRCPRCDGEEPEIAAVRRLCAQCGEPVWEDETYVCGPEGLLHEECLADYAFLDVTRDELLEFAEKHVTDFIRFVSEIRNFRTGEEAV